MRPLTVEAVVTRITGRLRAATVFGQLGASPRHRGRQPGPARRAAAGRRAPEGVGGRCDHRLDPALAGDDRRDRGRPFPRSRSTAGSRGRASGSTPPTSTRSPLPWFGRAQARGALSSPGASAVCRRGRSRAAQRSEDAGGWERAAFGSSTTRNATAPATRIGRLIGCPSGVAADRDRESSTNLPHGGLARVADEDYHGGWRGAVPRPRA